MTCKKKTLYFSFKIQFLMMELTIVSMVVFTYIFDLYILLLFSQFPTRS